MEDPYYKAGIEAERKRERVESSTPAPSVRADMVRGTDKKVSEMSEAEKDEAFSFDNWKRNRKR